MIHSLHCYNFLKIDPENYILFACQKYHERQICIQQEFLLSKGEKEETSFQKLYNIKIWELTLRELLIFKSLYLCKSQEKIVHLV